MCIYIVGRRNKIFLRLKANGKRVVTDTSVACFAKVFCVNKSLLIFDSSCLPLLKSTFFVIFHISYILVVLFKFCVED